MGFQNYPKYDYDPEEDKLLLQEHYPFEDVEIYGQAVECQFAILYPSGRLVVQKGFIWDAGTGAVDTISMVAASLAHDCLCRMTNDEHLDLKYRKKADKIFRKLLKHWGQAHPIEREWRWARWRVVREITRFKEWFK